jgi:hypothetical protein
MNWRRFLGVELTGVVQAECGIASLGVSGHAKIPVDGHDGSRLTDS